jgi:hypothetical protein
MTTLQDRLREIASKGVSLSGRDLQMEAADRIDDLNAQVANEREECADAVRFADNGTEAAEIIRSRSNT